MQQLRVDKELVIEINGPLDRDFAKYLKSRKMTNFLADPLLLDRELRSGSTIISRKEDADLILTTSLAELQAVASSKKRAAFLVKIRSRAEEEEALQAAEMGAELILAETPDWRIIPLENLVAKLQRQGVKLYARTESIDDVKSLLSVLEKGVDGLVIPLQTREELDSVLNAMQASADLELKPVSVTDIQEAGLGERVCIDTTSLLSSGEGVLIGNQSTLLFLVHNESLASPFTAPRPFRVNAGAIHSYILTEGGGTNYLSEIQSGSRVLVSKPDGSTRVVTVGRAKIERRPLILVRGEVDGVSGGIIVQNAETIRFVKADGSILSVTELARGDQILGMVGGTSGRHFGTEVDEFIIEK